MTQSETIAYWMGKDRETFVTEEEQSRQILGTYYLKPNQRPAAGGMSPIAAM